MSNASIHPFIAWSAIVGQLRAKYLQPVVPHLVTKQGVVLSIQGSEFHYSTPKVSGLVDYKAYEVMIMSKGDIALPEFMHVHIADLADDRRPELFAYVPEAKLCMFIDQLGGVCWQRSTAKLTEYVGQVMKKGRRS